ncbi:uncharacterized protein LOC103956294 isoform X1 [Pyrus x bretschneideri]|uniref:uncharacterized protein LOC103956294 isoform X1 n=1 Tax=Pyrus x bretschneideri TaxID=225117 RepID=UPI00202FC6A9|nr:uncharacterized protein LOC103956294 isoform X1 [Pyrus x bretschneideri]
MSLLTTYKCEGNGSIGDHILKLSDAAEKLNSMDVHISETQLVFMVLQALPAKYCQLKVSYNTQGNLWTLDELMAQCVQEERRLKQDKGKEIEAVNLVHASKGKSKKGGGFNPKTWHRGTIYEAWNATAERSLRKKEQNFDWDGEEHGV